MNVGMFAAVAAFCGSHERRRVRPATVKFDRAGGVVGRTRCYVAMLSSHLNGVEARPSCVSPGEVPVVCPAVHMSSKVGWLTRS